MKTDIQIIQNHLSGENWSCDFLFKEYITPDQIIFEKIEYNYPKDLTDVIRVNWNSQLENKKLALENNGMKVFIKPFEDKSNSLNLNAIYNELGKCIMWPGSVVLLDRWRINGNKLLISVFDSIFPIVNGLKDASVKNIFINNNLKVPRPPLAICTFAITNDGYLVLTQRGVKTNMYPGRYYGQGGNPTNSMINIVSHQIDEMVEEINILETDIDVNSFKIMGMVSDQELILDKPDLFGIVNLNIDSKSLNSKFNERQSINRPNDSVEIKLVHFDKESLVKFIDSTENTEFCPPARGALRLISQYYLN